MPLFTELFAAPFTDLLLFFAMEITFFVAASSGMRSHTENA
jgi:hypothetical protein